MLRAFAPWDQPVAGLRILRGHIQNRLCVTGPLKTSVDICPAPGAAAQYDRAAPAAIGQAFNNPQFDPIGGTLFSNRIMQRRTGARAGRIGGLATPARGANQKFNRRGIVLGRAHSDIPLLGWGQGKVRAKRGKIPGPGPSPRHPARLTKHPLLAGLPACECQSGALVGVPPSRPYGPVAWGSLFGHGRGGGCVSIPFSSVQDRNQPVRHRSALWVCQAPGGLACGVSAKFIMVVVSSCKSASDKRDRGLLIRSISTSSRAICGLPSGNSLRSLA